MGYLELVYSWVLSCVIIIDYEYKCVCKCMMEVFLWFYLRCYWMLWLLFIFGGSLLMRIIYMILIFYFLVLNEFLCNLSLSNV